MPARRDRPKTGRSRGGRERAEPARPSFADVLREIARVPRAIGSRRPRTVLVTDGPFAETREHLG